MNTKLAGVARVLFAVSAVLGTACGSTKTEPTEPTPKVAAAPEYAATATIKDIMKSFVDPSADVVWNAVHSVVGPKGIQEVMPKTDEEWEETRAGAIRLVEATNLLLMPGRHVAGPGEKSEAPEAELEPEQMEVLINQDRQAWNKRVKDLHDVAAEVLRAIDKRDTDAIFEIGERIDEKCEACHTHYWYPNQKLPPGYDRP